MNEPVINARLPVTLRPNQGESVRGYVMRLASANCYPSPQWVVDLIRKKYSAIFESATFLKGLAHIAGLDEEDVNVFSLSQLAVPTACRQFTHNRVCPKCLVTFKYIDSIWDFRFASACPIHGVYLLDECRECGEPLSWNRAAIDYCDCGASLTKVKVRKANNWLLYYNSKIWHSCGRDVPDFEIPGAPDKFLSGLSIKYLCQIYSLMSLHGNIELKPAVRSRRLSETIFGMRNMHALFSDWPFGLYKYLDRCKNAKKGSKAEGLQQVFGSFYIQLYKIQSRTVNKFIIDAFELYLKSNWVGIVDHKYRRLSQSFKNDFTVNTFARKELGISQDSFNRMIDIGLFKGVVKKPRQSGRIYTILTKSEVEKFAEVVSHIINKKKTCSLMGISDRQFTILAEQGKINPIIRSGQLGSLEWWVDEREIHELINRIIMVVPCRQVGPDGIPFSRVCQAHLTNIHLLPILLDDILTGKVPVAGVKHDKLTEKYSGGHDPIKLSDLYFYHEDIVRFRARVRNMQTDIYSISEAAKFIGVKQEVMYHLVNKGFIASHSDKDRFRKGRIVLLKDIIAFEYRYIAQTSLTDSDRSPSAVKQMLAEWGIFPAIGGETDNCRQIFYNRDRIPKWLMPFDCDE